MKPAASPREYQLKHRLAGAVIMISVAVLVIPWLLPTGDVAPGTSPDSTRKIGGDGLVSEVVPLLPVTPPTESPTAVDTTDEASVTLPLQPQDDAPRPALLGGGNAITGAGNDGDDNADAITDTTDTADKSPQWKVTVGSFSKPENIEAVTAKLSAAGYAAKKTAVTTAAGKAATRIWLGPFASQDEAQKIGAEVKSLFDESVVTKQAQ